MNALDRVNRELAQTRIPASLRQRSENPLSMDDWVNFFNFLVLARMQAFSQIHFMWTRFRGSQATDLWYTPDLAILEHPWGPTSCTADLLARMEVDVSLAGNAYIVR